MFCFQFMHTPESSEKSNISIQKSGMNQRTCILRVSALQVGMCLNSLSNVEPECNPFTALLTY